jgi:hypothetical protein
MKTATIDRSLTYFASVTVVLFVALPLVAVSAYIAEPKDSMSPGAVEATVGVGVILRAVAQRLFRAGASNVVRLTFGTMTRTIARTAVTRTIRIFIRSSAGSVAKDLMGRDGESVQVAPRASLTAIIYGLIGTAFSFWGVLLFTSMTVVEQLHDELGLSVGFMILAALIPLVYLCLACLLATRLFHTTTSFLTGLDGLLIQAYFTLSGSFLPMTTDFEFHGSPRAKSFSSLFAIFLMMFAFGVLRVLGAQLGDSSLVFASAMFLTYLFVYSFPVKPLLGFNIWRHSKLLWLCMFIPILAAFLFVFPQSVAALL